MLSNVTQRTVEIFNSAGIAGFGLGMPALSPSWTDGNVSAITVNEANMSLTLGSGNWLAPLAGTLSRINPSDKLRVTLIRADGQPLSGQDGMLLTLFPQLYLRLSRLYAQVLEPANAGRPERERGLPLRPVPRYFFFAGITLSGTLGDRDGNIKPRDVVGNQDELTVYDNNGMPLDPLAVASILLATMTKHPVLQQRPLSSPPAQVNTTQLKAIADLAGSSSAVRVRLSDHAGAPYDGTHLNGVTAAHAASGLFTINSGLSGSITVASASTGFPAEERRLLLLGPATTGRMGQTFSLPSLPTGVTLKRDFFSVRVAQLKPFLLGQPNPDFTGTKVEKPPAIRTNEPLRLLVDGNDVLGAANTALSGTTQEALAVAQTMAGNFIVPNETGENAHWPNFPAVPGGTTPAPEGPLPVNLRDGFDPIAEWFDDGNVDTANVDVVLTLNNLPVGAAVRVYPRKFIADAREARGDGAGGVVPASGTLQLLLKDPLSLRRPGVPESAVFIPTQATLMCDVMVVKRSQEARLYGDIETPISGTTTNAPPSNEINGFASAARRGVSNAGILGLHSQSGPLPSNPLDAIVALTGEATPRDASRWPTMARRDLLVAGLSNGNWRAVLSGGRLTAEAHSAQSRLGTPGGLGGRETQYVGVSTQNGQLAYDIARMAFHRTTNIVDRMSDLAESTWNEPAALSSGGANAGTIAGAILQTIAPFCETPELHLIKDLIDPAALPTSFDALVDWLKPKLNSAFPPAAPQRNRIINVLETRLDSLKDNSALTESDKERLFNELHREIMASCFGRRDAQWALKGAISRACHFIYIESPGFAATQKDDYSPDPVPNYAADLIALMGNRLNQAPGLHLIICMPKHPDDAPGYEAIAAHEAHDRRQRILNLPTAQSRHPRVTAFHPVGFPGRPSRLESTVVIVDDLWALVGSSTFRRRGLTFDGGSDLVFTDTELVSGRSQAIANFRRQLMATRLSIRTADNAFDPNLIKLNDGIEAFYLIRDMLQAGGLGKIERLWNGRTPGVEPIDPTGVSQGLANPEGHEFNLAEALAQAWLAGWNSY